MVAADWRSIRVADCELSVRTCRVLAAEHGDDVTLGQIAAKTDAELVRSPNIGRRTLREINEMILLMKHTYPEAPPPSPIFIPSAEIDWALLGRAVEFYKARGYTYVEAPWAVSDETLAITCPNPRFAARVEALGSLVGSAEQSFLHMDLAGDLGPGCFVACTPCFRLGDHEDGLHHPYFMKVELYRNDHDVMAMLRMIADAGELLRDLGAPSDALLAPQTDQGVDITLNGIEVGSFGLRTHENADGSLHHWTYGTGLALPRFSQALEVEGPNAAMKKAIAMHRDLTSHLSVENGVSKLSPAGIAALLEEDA